VDGRDIAPQGNARHGRRTSLPAPVQELFLKHRFIGLKRETRFSRVRYQHVDASGTPIDDG
jgi:hypothetical protein